MNAYYTKSINTNPNSNESKKSQEEARTSSVRKSRAARQERQRKMSLRQGGEYTTTESNTLNPNSLDNTVTAENQKEHEPSNDINIIDELTVNHPGLNGDDTNYPRGSAQNIQSDKQTLQSLKNNKKVSEFSVKPPQINNYQMIDPKDINAYQTQYPGTTKNIGGDGLASLTNRFQAQEDFSSHRDVEPKQYLKYGGRQLKQYFRNKVSKGINNQSTGSFRNSMRRSQNQVLTSTIKEREMTVTVVKQDSLQNQNLQLKQSFLSNAAQIKQNTSQFKLRNKIGNTRNDQFNSYLSGAGGNNTSKNYSINSRINNPRPVNNMGAKNLVVNNYISQLKKVTINEKKSRRSNHSIISHGSFEQVSVDDDSFSPGAKRNMKTKHKKIKFDDIMKGVQFDSGSPLKKAAAIAQSISVKPNQMDKKLGKEIDQIKTGMITNRKQTNKTFNSGMTNRNYIQYNKKMPQTTKNALGKQNSVSVSFNTGLQTTTKQNTRNVQNIESMGGVKKKNNHTIGNHQAQASIYSQSNNIHKTVSYLASPRQSITQGKSSIISKANSPSKVQNGYLSAKHRIQTAQDSLKHVSGIDSFENGVPVIQTKVQSITLFSDNKPTGRASLANVEKDEQLVKKIDFSTLNTHSAVSKKLTAKQAHMIKSGVNNSMLTQSKSLNALLTSFKTEKDKIGVMGSKQQKDIQTITEEMEYNTNQQKINESHSQAKINMSARAMSNAQGETLDRLKTSRDKGSIINKLTTQIIKTEKEKSTSHFSNQRNTIVGVLNVPKYKKDSQSFHKTNYSMKDFMSRKHSVGVQHMKKELLKSTNIPVTEIKTKVVNTTKYADTSRVSFKQNNKSQITSSIKEDEPKDQLQKDISKISIQFKVQQVDKQLKKQKEKNNKEKNDSSKTGPLEPNLNIRISKSKALKEASIQQNMHHPDQASGSKDKELSKLIEDLKLKQQYRTTANDSKGNADSHHYIKDITKIDEEPAFKKNKEDSKKSESMILMPKKSIKYSFSKGALRDKKHSEHADYAKSNKTRSNDKSMPETEVTLSSPKKLEDTVKKANISAILNSKTSISNPVNRLSSLSGKVTTEAAALKRAPEYPMSAEDAIKQLKLNDFEIQECKKYDKQIYYGGQLCKNKVKSHPIKYVQTTNTSMSGLSEKHKAFQRRSSHKTEIQNNQATQMIPSQRQLERLEQMNIFNYGYDDEQGDYKTKINDHIGYRYQVIESIGSGSFGQALKCLDHKTNELLAVKIIRNQKKFQYQAGMELKILKYLNYHDKQDQNNIIKVNDYMIFRDHLIISFELLSLNLYEFIKKNDFKGITQNLIRRFAIQILQALKFQQNLNLVHCDLKPENILLKSEHKSGIKLIDYGSSCFLGQRIYTYIQSRFYRAPEIILGIPYTTAIDMWSFGAIIAELLTGYPLFPGEDEVEQLAYIMEIYDAPSLDVIRLSTRGHLFFHKNGDPILSANSKGKTRRPLTKKLSRVLRCDDENFLDFLNKCFIWNPTERMTPLEALQHPWILEGLPEKVLKHHTKMFGNSDNKAALLKATMTSVQGFPPDKKDVTVTQMVEEQVQEDQKREMALHRKQNSELEVLKSDKLITKAEIMASLKQQKIAELNESSNSQMSPIKERKSRKQRLTRQSDQKQSQHDKSKQSCIPYIDINSDLQLSKLGDDQESEEEENEEQIIDDLTQLVDKMVQS